MNLYNLVILLLIMFGWDVNIQSGNCWSDLTDHLPSFCLLTSKNTKQESGVRPFIRIYSTSDIRKFKGKNKKKQ